ncbi:Hypothetical predicted protein [Olea europaea subsp. europaea]|uniref:Uncharacterized protein n=1 Tax=Olea europaea subsp. europaea TaxID=158383 RepID=A0A8S0TKD4_OLEEU|nr:Hypothetical predicted protein [Olea europaea subsp. europaea]
MALCRSPQTSLVNVINHLMLVGPILLNRSQLVLTIKVAHVEAAMLSSKVFEPIRRVLSERAFTDFQIERVLPKLHEEYRRRPEMLGEIVDTWNRIMGQSLPPSGEYLEVLETIPATASAPKNSPLSRQAIDMCTMLSEVEPTLLMLDPKKLERRHNNIQGLGLTRNSAERWAILFNAPRGFYLQDWKELTRKVYYIEHKVLDLLYDKKEQREMETHPLVRSAASVEADFDHIRTRYLFASRAGFRELSHMYNVQTVTTRLSLKDLILSDDANFLEKFSPYCSDEEYSSFANLIKNHELDEEDCDVCNLLADLDSIRHPETVNARLKEQLRGARD